jgi:ribosomal-protein-alanine N-acetyltransferase
MRASRKEGESLADLSFRLMSAEDIAAVFSILKESPEASLWSEQSLADSATQGNSWVAERARKVKGILIGRTAADEFEILNLAVAPNCRRQGIATRLVTAAMEHASAAGALRTYLEVRASNQDAIAFYERLGFAACGRRPHYYQHPTEDALLLRWHQNRNFL